MSLSCSTEKMKWEDGFITDNGPDAITWIDKVRPLGLYDRNSHLKGHPEITSTPTCRE